jgi:hypothetical protein
MGSDPGTISRRWRFVEQGERLGTVINTDGVFFIDQHKVRNESASEMISMASLMEHELSLSHFSNSK